MGSYFFLQIVVVVVCLSLFTTIFNKRILGLPPAIGIPIVSAICAFVLQSTASTLFTSNEYVYINIPKLEEAVRHIDFYDFLINGVICFVLTASALKFKVSDLQAHWKPISILATLSLVVCAFIFGGLIFGFQYLLGSPVPLIVLLLLGSALGATDPIGVKGVLSSVKAPNHLMVKLEGESLFNDAMCIAVFMTIFNIIKGGEFTFIGVLETLAFEVIVAAVIGYVCGMTGLKLLKISSDDIKSLILVTTLLAAGSYLIALYSHASAPIACVIAGLVVGNKWKEFLEERDVDEVNHFWHTAEDLINSFLFTLIGLELFLIELNAKLVLGGIEKVISKRIIETTTAVVAKYRAEDLLKQREIVKNQIVADLSKKLVAYNIIVEDVQITEFKFSDAYAKAIEDKQIAEQSALTAVNNTRTVQEKAKQAIETAKGEAEAIRIQSEAIRENGGQAYLDLQAVKQWDGKLPVTMAGNGTVPFINVGK